MENDWNPCLRQILVISRQNASFVKQGENGKADLIECNSAG